MSGLLNSLAFRWGYFHGSPIQVKVTLQALLPLMLKECPHLCRFLQLAANGAEQVAAYMVIFQMLSPTMEPHKWETIARLDRLVLPHLALVLEADSSPVPIFAETRAYMLKAAVKPLC